MTTNLGALRIRQLLAIVILFTAVGFVYSNSFEGSFHSDDYITIQSHPEIEHPELLWRFPPHYRQWLTASYAMNFAQGGLDPFGYHAVNLVLHLLSSCLLMALIRLTLFEGRGWSAKQANRVAFISGTLFALHPVHTEAVTYISGRSSGLSSFLYLAALFLFATSQLKNISLGKKTTTLLLMFLTGIGAILSKETSLTLPLGLLLFDLCFMRGNSWLPRANRWKIIYGPLVAGAVLIFLISPTFSFQVFQWLNRIEWGLAVNQLPVLTHAYKLIFFPFNLTFDYDFSQASFSSGPLKIFFALFWMILLTTAWAFRRQNPPAFTFSIFWFLIILSPTNSILPRMDLLSERNLYLPSIGVCWWWGLQLNSLLEKKANFRLAPIVSASLLIIGLCYGTLTHTRNKVYLNDITLWQDTFKKSPNKSEVHYYLAMAHYLAGDLEGSRREIERLSQKDPSIVKKITATSDASQRQLENYLQLLDKLKQVVHSDPSQYKMYGQVYRELSGLFQHPTPLYFTRLLLGAQMAVEGNLKQAEAEFRQARTARPHLPHAYLDLAALLLKRGQANLAIKEMEQAKNKIHLAPELQPRWHLTRSQILFMQNNMEAAKKEAFEFVDTAIDKSEGYLLLGNIEMSLKHQEQAINYWQHVTNPRELKAEALFKIAMAHILKNKFNEGKEALTKTIQLAPGNLAARFNLAKLILERGGNTILARQHLEYLLNNTGDANKRHMVEQLLARIPQDHELN